MTLHEILKAKGTEVYTIPPETTVQEVIQTLVQYNVGSLVVCQRDASKGEQLVGIVTERDILHLCASSKGHIPDRRVSEVMSTDLVTGSPADSVEATMGLMTKNRIRHLPVLSEGRLVGLVSIGDVVKVQHDRLAMENQFMKDYIRSS
jgi:CBS domain-containing protein